MPKKLFRLFKMESKKYLIIITLIDGQNFTIPDGTSDRVEAYVFAEARFGNESVLRSDPIRLVNSNPEFVTELAWQLDKKSLHQLRVERKAIKLQVFMQTRERKKAPTQKAHDDRVVYNGITNESAESSKVELIGYTILDLRSAQDTDQVKFRWLPLLNPKFRKSSYNRPEIQIALTLSCVNDEAENNGANQVSSISSIPDQENETNSLECLQNHDANLSQGCNETSGDTKILYTTCLDTSTDINTVNRDETIDNDIIVRPKEKFFYVYDAKNPFKSTIEDCDESYRLTINIPFSSGLDLLTEIDEGKYHFSIRLFGTTLRTEYFRSLTGPESKEIVAYIRTTGTSALSTYFELNSNADITLYGNKPLGIATIQLNQLCSLDAKCRSIEGIYALQALTERVQDLPPGVNPTMGLSVVLEKIEYIEATTDLHQQLQMTREHFGADIDTYLSKSINDTHQLTFEDSVLESCPSRKNNLDDELVVEDYTGPNADDHHYCFTIDLKKFSYTPSQKLIPTLRELVIRYSYPFFGYKDTITTDASIPINANSSIIVSGFCEFNFATTPGPLLTALRELPLNLDILAFDDSRLKDIESNCNERQVATCKINLAEALDLSEANVEKLVEDSISKTVSVPIFSLDGRDMGQLQIFLCIKNMGRPKQKLDSNSDIQNTLPMKETKVILEEHIDLEENKQKLEVFMSDMAKKFEIWKEECSNKLSDELRERCSERFRRLSQRVEAKEAERELEFKRKLQELNNLEKKFKNSLACVDSLEKLLADSLEQMKAKTATMDNRLDIVEAKISEAIGNKKLDRSDGFIRVHAQRSLDDSLLDSRNKTSARVCFEKNQTTRSRPKNLDNGTANIPIPIRSSSLVRRPSDGSSTRIVTKRSFGGPTTTVLMNGVQSRGRSNSVRPTLSKETLEKLTSLRKEKAELLKRGCKPGDESIREINSLIEKLAC